MPKGLLMKEQNWWDIIEVLADYIRIGIDYDQLDDEAIVLSLQDFGFTRHQIEQAYQWLEQATRTCSLSEIIAISHGSQESTRIANPLEKAFISNQLWEKLIHIRFKGLVSDELLEKFLESIRSIDTRDWEEEELTAMLGEFIDANVSQLNHQNIKKLLQKKGRISPDFYC